jgi:hypothetical protein
LTKTREYQDQQTAHQQEQSQAQNPGKARDAAKQQEQDDFQHAQQLPQNRKRKVAPQEGLQRTSYWLPTSQPARVEAAMAPPERPASPHSGQPLRRKDLRPVALSRHANSDDVLCAISSKPIRNQAVVAYWTGKDKAQPGVVCLKQVYDMTVTGTNSSDDKKKSSKERQEQQLCPLTNAKIRHMVQLQSGGSGFAAHNAVQVKVYRPTIT